jgi:hypothetical protein
VRAQVHDGDAGVRRGVALRQHHHHRVAAPAGRRRERRGGGGCEGEYLGCIDVC